MTDKPLLKSAMLSTGAVVRSLAPAAVVSSLSSQSGQMRSAGMTAAPPSPVSQAEIGRIKEEARQEGLALGKTQAQAEVERVVRQKLAAVDELMRSLAKATQQHQRQVERLLSEFAFVAVGRVLGDAIRKLPEDMIAGSVRAALAACGTWDQVKLELHPRDVETVTLALGPDTERLQKTLHFQASSAVKLGGCRVVLDDGVLDARLDVQLEQLRDALDAARDTWTPGQE